MKKLTGRAIGGFLLSLLIIGVMVCVYAEPTGTDESVLASGDANLNISEPVIPDIPPMPKTTNQLIANTSFIEGNGNLTRFIEVNSTAGQLARGLLQVVGTNATSWKYILVSGNQSSMGYVVGHIIVDHAQAVIFNENATTPDNQVSDARVQLAGEIPGNMGFCSGEIMIEVIAHDNSSYSWINTNNEQGTLSHANKAYHVNLSAGSDASRDSDNSETQWSLTQKKTIPENIPMGLDRFVKSDINLIQGTMKTYESYAVCTPDGSLTVQNPSAENAGSINAHTYASEFPENKATNNRGSNEGLYLNDVVSMRYSAAALNSAEGIWAFGITSATANTDLEFSVIPAGERCKGPWVTARSDVELKGSPKRTGSDRVSIPITFDGWNEGSLVNGVYRISENYSAKGAMVLRSTEGGVYPADGDMPQAGVIANISAGKMDAQGASGISGSSSLMVDGKTGNTTTMAGSWIVTSPKGVPVSRWTEGLMPGASAYSSSSTMTGTKSIKEQAYWRNNLVDAS